MNSLRKPIIHVVLSNVIGGVKVRFSATKQISDAIGFLCDYQKMSKEELNSKAARLAEKYSKEISNEDLVQVMNFISMVHNAYLGRKLLGGLELLNALIECRLESIFFNLSISLRMFIIAPVTVGSAERSFSKHKLIMYYLRSIMDQDRLNNLARLSIESDIAK